MGKSLNQCAFQRMSLLPAALTSLGSVPDATLQYGHQQHVDDCVQDSKSRLKTFLPRPAKASTCFTTANSKKA